MWDNSRLTNVVDYLSAQEEQLVTIHGSQKQALRHVLEYGTPYNLHAMVLCNNDVVRLDLYGFCILYVPHDQTFIVHYENVKRELEEILVELHIPLRVVVRQPFPRTGAIKQLLYYKFNPHDVDDRLSMEAVMNDFVGEMRPRPVSVGESPWINFSEVDYFT